MQVTTVNLFVVNLVGGHGVEVMIGGIDIAEMTDADLEVHDGIAGRGQGR
jgi:hypothetical protein